MQFIRSNTFHWAAALAALFAAFVTILFGFIYFKIDDYLIARSDRMITTQVNFFAALPPDRLVSALDDHLGQDSRGVHFAGIFDANGNRLAGNVARLPDDLAAGAGVKSVRMARANDKEPDAPLVRAVARSLDHGNLLVIGRNVDETREISRVVGGGARAWPVARVLLLAAGRRVAERSCAETRRGGQPAGPAYHRRGSARAAAAPEYR